MKKTRLVKRMTIAIITILMAVAFIPTFSVNAAVINRDAALDAKAPEEVVANIETLYNTNATVIKGDVDLNGTADILDVTLIEKYITEIETLDNAQKEAADVNNDGLVDIMDCTEIQKLIVGIA